MPCHGQLVVGVLVEVEVGEGGALLVQEKVFENPELMWAGGQTDLLIFLILQLEKLKIKRVKIFQVVC